MNKISDRFTRKTINDIRFLGNTLIEIEEPKITQTEIISMKKIITKQMVRF